MLFFLVEKKELILLKQVISIIEKEKSTYGSKISWVDPIDEISSFNVALVFPFFVFEELCVLAGSSL